MSQRTGPLAARHERAVVSVTLSTGRPVWLCLLACGHTVTRAARTRTQRETAPTVERCRACADPSPR